MNLFISSHGAEVDFFEHHNAVVRSSHNSLRPALSPEYLPEEYKTDFNSVEYRKEISDLFNADLSALHEELTISFINAGCNTLLVPMRSMDNLMKVNTYSSVIEAYCEEHHIDCLVLFAPDMDYTMKSFSVNEIRHEPTSEYAAAALGYVLRDQGVKWSNLRIVDFDQYGAYEIVSITQRAGRLMYSIR